MGPRPRSPRVAVVAGALGSTCSRGVRHPGYPIGGASVTVRAGHPGVPFGLSLFWCALVERPPLHVSSTRWSPSMACLGRLRWGARGARSRPTARTPMHARPSTARLHDPRIRFPRAEVQLNSWPPGARGRCALPLSPQPGPAGVGRRCPCMHTRTAPHIHSSRRAGRFACCVSAGKPRLRLGPAGVR